MELENPSCHLLDLRGSRSPRFVLQSGIREKVKESFIDLFLSQNKPT